MSKRKTRGIIGRIVRAASGADSLLRGAADGVATIANAIDSAQTAVALCQNGVGLCREGLAKGREFADRIAREGFTVKVPPLGVRKS